jgi:glycerate 2-kinase
VGRFVTIPILQYDEKPIYCSLNCFQKYIKKVPGKCFYAYIRESYREGIKAMNVKLLGEMRTEAEEIFRHSLKAVDPYQAVKRFVRVEGNLLILGGEGSSAAAFNLDGYDRFFIVGGGKATAPMARALEDLLGEKIYKGLIIVKYGFAEKLNFIEVVEAGHPIPDQNGVKGTKGLLHFLESAKERDLVFSLISGGGSALLTQPVGNITLEEKQEITRVLLECGASIDEMNTVRKHLSSVKGGQMARIAYPATVINLMLSDVVGDRLDVIASGPFTPDSTQFKDAQNILKKYDLKEIPATVLEHLEMGVLGQIAETPKQNDMVFKNVHHFIVGSNIQALEAAGKRAEAYGYRSMILSSMIEGETKDVARVHVAIAKEILKTGQPFPPPACIISGGETTVTIRGSGIGGRNQEFCLAAAIDLEGAPPNVVILSGGSDGNDGPTDAAGAIVDSHTVIHGKGKEMDASLYLRNNDAYSFFEKTGSLLITGPTKTNVMDIRIMLVR